MLPEVAPKAGEVGETLGLPWAGSSPGGSSAQGSCCQGGQWGLSLWEMPRYLLLEHLQAAAALQGEGWVKASPFGCCQEACQ